MSLQLHRPDGKGGLEVRTVADRDWRTQLQSPRWGKSLRHKRLPSLKNPEMNPTSNWMAVLFWVGLAVLTLLILVVGYGIDFWSFPVLASSAPPEL
jgi:hypothetical protein